MSPLRASCLLPGFVAGIALLAPAAASAAETRQYIILFGFGDTAETVWDGSIRASGARITGLEGWRLSPKDHVEGARWRLSTRRVNLTRGQNLSPRTPILENGLHVQAEIRDPNARLEIETAQGAFSFAVSEIAWGRASEFLGGRVKVEQVPVTRRLTSSIEEDDFPALADAGDRVYLAFVEFTHGDRSQDWPRQLVQKPDSYEPLARPAGGDQVWLMEYSRSTGSWNPPQPVSEKGQDVYRVAVAADGEGRVWVVWSAQAGGNFDLFARFLRKGEWSKTMRLTDHPGPDLSPVAATDSGGHVWVGWQGWRDSFDVLAIRQQGETFSSEQRVSASPANDWAPQIAAGPNGEVAVVWDTYDKGDYDVYARRLRWAGGLRMDEALPVAASARFEARATAAYDAAGRLWIAYEESYPAWGKDFGAYETTGSGLYQASAVRVKVLSGNRYFQPVAPLGPVLSERPATQPFNKARGGRFSDSFTPQPAPQLARDRRPGSTPYEGGYPSNGYPRLAASPEGAVFLAYRTAAGRVWGPLGTAWFENLVWFDGKSWTGPVFVAHSDGILDNRPALIGLKGSSLLMVAPSDYRFASSGTARRRDEEPFQYDLFAHIVIGGFAPSEAALSEIPPEQPAPPSADVASEKAQVELMRSYRVKLDSPSGRQELRLLRGEFHRHTAISGDGGNDGDIIDAWRYFIDAAYMDWAGCCDHDNGGGREYTWWITQKMTDAFRLPGRFTPMFSYERSVRYPEGHRNVVFARRGVRPLPRLPKMADDSPPSPAPDTQMLYEYLRYFDGIAAVHTSATNMGTDWRDNDPQVEPVVEIYQGDRQNYEMPGAPRSNGAGDSIGGWRPLGFVNLALEKGYRLAFQASSDHISTHMSYCNVWVTEPTREAILEAFKKRRVYGATDNILADVRCSGHFMGEEFSLPAAPRLEVKLAGPQPFARVHIIKDGRYAYTVEPGTREVSFTWQDAEAVKNKTSYYYVRGEQTDGEIVWASPMWIRVE